jgi:hypothetical protein
VLENFKDNWRKEGTTPTGFAPARTATTAAAAQPVA